MEFSHLQSISMPVLRNRLIMLHHFSDLFCKSLTLFGMQPKYTDLSASHETAFESFDQLRSLLVSSSKVNIYYNYHNTPCIINVNMCSCSIIIFIPN